MNDLVVLTDQQRFEPLETMRNERLIAILTYQSKGKWRVAKALVSDLAAERIMLACMTPDGGRPQPVNIQPGQSVGLSFKLPCGKCVMETRVVALQPAATGEGGGRIVVEMPDGIEVIQRRSYFRVNVPPSLRVDVVLWRRSGKSGPHAEPSRYCHGQLVDISAGGAQVALQADVESEGNEEAEPGVWRVASAPPGRDNGISAPGLHNGQFIEMRFTPLPYEPPMLLAAQIRNIWPSADGSKLYLGLQLVGLEATAEGHQLLARLVNVVEQYHRMNESGPIRQQSDEPGRSVAETPVMASVVGS
ncbi:MAG TPA: PilZ domain-containing protein [Phycisphaerales bacterium]|nr:PilZ domain-containing protein [Phycisphaerales bacterium]